jgi:hypothetical protein
MRPCRSVSLPPSATAYSSGSSCAADADHFSRLLALLKKEKARPSKSKGLAGKVKSWFPRLTEDERLDLVQRLFKESRVHESEKVLTYNL